MGWTHGCAGECSTMDSQLTGKKALLGGRSSDFHDIHIPYVSNYCFDYCDMSLLISRNIFNLKVYLV